MATDAHRVIEAVWRIESAKLIAGLARMVKDVGLAEDLAQDALVAALEKWPDTGVPDRPGAWLMATAKRRAIDHFRRGQRLKRKHEQLGRELDEATASAAPDLDAGLDDTIGDDLLSLIFIACHPVLTPEARVALTLRLLGGLTTPEIARAFLVPEPTIAQRIVRAKRALSEARVPFEVPRGAAFVARLASVLEVLYLIFNEGYAATAGEHWTRPTLCEEALRLGRILAGLVPGEPLLLLDQNRARWDWLQVGRGLEALDRALRLGGARGPYALQAAITACHARARTAAETDWARIASLYAVLGEVAPSPVVELNRAMAVAMAEGPAAGLAIVDRLVGEPALRAYHRLPGARADLLSRLGRHDEARAEYRRAAALAGNARERAMLTARAQECARKAAAEAGEASLPPPPARRAARRPSRPRR